MSEWLRRQTRNLLGFACAGSNPAVDVLFVIFFSHLSYYTLTTLRSKRRKVVAILSFYFMWKDGYTLEVRESKRRKQRTKWSREISISLNLSLSLHCKSSGHPHPLMASSALHSNFALFSPIKKPVQTITTTSYTPIRCGPRDNRGPLMKGRVLSIEAIQAIQSLKRAHRGDPTKIDDFLSKTLSRLVKADLLATLNELLRQDQCDLALRVFSAVRSELWYKTELSLYADLVSALARKGMKEEIDRLICDLEGEGSVRCDDKGIVRLVKAVIAAERRESTVRIYGLMKRSGCGGGDEYVGRVLSRGLRRLGELGVADEVDLEFGRLSKGNLEKVEA